MLLLKVDGILQLDLSYFGNKQSDKLATSKWNEVSKLLVLIGKKLRRDISDGDTDYESDFYVLRKTNCPAVLSENFFQNAKSDVEFLTSKEGKQIVVDYHVNGIIKYLER